TDKTISPPPAALQDNARSSQLPDSASRIALRKKRANRDRMARWGITAAGYGVVLALLTIFVYLFYEVMPILRGATVKQDASYALAGQQAETVHLLLDRYEELGIQYTDTAEVV